MRFLFIGSRFTFHASFPHSVTLVQLRFASLVLVNLWRDLHPQVCAHAGRTTKKNHPQVVLKVRLKGHRWELGQNLLSGLPVFGNELRVVTATEKDCR